MTTATAPEELTAGGLLDADWYRVRYPDVAAAGVDPIGHFLRFGGGEGRSPNPYFDPAWYLGQHPEAGPTGLDALLHYQREGDRRGLRPMPLFDPAWYRASYGIDPATLALGHFLRERRSGRFLPCPLLYAVPHLEQYRGDPGRGIDPFEHYLRDAAQAGLEPFPDSQVAAGSGLIDENYYLINGSDVHDAGASPADHFCRYGWREGRQPNIYFDTRWYQLTNPAVVALGINPLVHYVLEGEAANRRPVPYFDPAWYRRTYDVPAGKRRWHTSWRIGAARRSARRRSSTSPGSSNGMPAGLGRTAILLRITCRPRRWRISIRRRHLMPRHTAGAIWGGRAVPFAA